jgi:hypothetical protein
MATPILERRAAGVERNAFDAVLPYLDAAEQKLGEAQAALGCTDAVIEVVEEALALLPGSPDHWLLQDSAEGKAARKLDRLRQRRGQIPGSATATTFLTVDELAGRIGISDATARTYLERGLIPGARKADPTRPKSRWLIPEDAPARYMEEG